MKAMMDAWVALMQSGRKWMTQVIRSWRNTCARWRQMGHYLRKKSAQSFNPRNQRFRQKNPANPIILRILIQTKK
jgi:hypothetical protein